jgi:hypothetical protein
VIAALEQAEQERLRREAEETRQLRAMFIPGAEEPPPKDKPKPVYRDWLLP